MPTGFRLPAYEPGIAPADFAPINNLLTTYRQQQQLGIENQRADEQMGMQRERFGMEREKFNEQKQQAVRERAGNLALAAMTLDPATRAQRWPEFIKTHPNAAGLDPTYHDPNTGPLKVLADAGMAQSYLDHQLKQQAARLQANQDARAAAAEGRNAELFPYQRDSAKIDYDTKLRNYNTPPENLQTVKEGETLVRTSKTPGGTPEVVFRGGEKQDATTKKAIDETDDFVAQTKSAIGSLQRALELNDKAYSGALAETRAGAVNNTLGAVVPREGAIATGELANVVTNQALSSLRATFGGNPTEGERKILLDVAGSVSQPATLRKQIYIRAMQAAQDRLRFNDEKAKALRAGTYYQPGGQPPTPDINAPRGSAPQQQAPRSEPQRAIPPGNYRYDPATGQLVPAGP